MKIEEKNMSKINKYCKSRGRENAMEQNLQRNYGVHPASNMVFKEHHGKKELYLDVQLLYNDLKVSLN